MNQDARKVGFTILLGIAFYLPIEDYFLRWLPFSIGFLIALRQAPEIIVWMVALGAAALHLSRHGTIIVIGRRIDLFLIGFVAVAVGTAFLNNADVFVASISLKALLRYIPLIYALIMLAPDDSQLARIPRVVLLAFCIQIGVGLLEWIVGQPAKSLFSVVNAWGGFSFVGVPLERLLIHERYDVTGTQARPAVFAYFLLVGLAVWIVQFKKRPRMYWTGVGLALLMTFQSHSRMAVFGAVLLLVMHQVSLHGARKTLWMTVLLLPLIGALTLSLGSSLTEHFYFLDVFTREYRENALNQRLGLIVYILPNVFDGGVTLLGHSSDLGVVAEAVGEHFELPAILAFVFVTIVEDVYWLAMLLYYGFIGLACFALFFGRLTALVVRTYRQAEEGVAKEAALVATFLLLLAIPLNAINQTFEMRQFAYYLWFFAGAAIASARNASMPRPQVREAQ